MFLFVLMLIQLASMSAQSVEVGASECNRLVYFYSECKYGNDSLSENFFQQELNQTSFEDAMNYFRSIYVQLDLNACNNSLCECVNASFVNNSLYQHPIQAGFGAFFTDPNHYSYMLDILKTIRNSFTTFVSVANQSSTVGEYCNNYDYSTLFLFKYNQTLECVSRVLECDSIFAANTFSYSMSTLDNFVNCSLDKIANCDLNVKRAILFYWLTFYPQYIQGDLATFIDSQLNLTNLTSPSTSDQTTLITSENTSYTTTSIIPTNTDNFTTITTNTINSNISFTDNITTTSTISTTNTINSNISSTDNITTTSTISFTNFTTENDTVTSTTSTTSTTLSIDYRVFVWSMGDPHFVSVKKGYETCDYKPWGVYVNSDKIFINSTTVQAWPPYTVTIMTGIYITFKNGNDTVYYVGDSNSLRGTFDNNKTVVYDGNNNKWLELQSQSYSFTWFSYTYRYSYAIITDYNSKSIIYLNEWSGWYSIMMSTTISTLQSGGMFYDGCPDHFIHYYKRKRATSSATSACSSSTSSADPSLVNLKTACENDVTTTGDTSFGAMFTVTATASNDIKAREQAIFPTITGSSSSTNNSNNLLPRSTLSIIFLLFILFKQFLYYFF